jgi:hypothetical protein
MASSGKKKTTMAKLMRESRLRERKMAKAARKDARRSGELDVHGQHLDNWNLMPSTAGADESSPAEPEGGLSE